jgi:group I intron endonuclease
MLIKIKNESSFNIQRQCGIYAIRCLTNNRIYVGSTKQSFRARFSNHCKFLKSGKLSNKKLQTDYTLYGPDNFEFEILSVIINESDIVITEQYFINNLRPYYNYFKIAHNSSKTNDGKKFSEEHKQKIREKSKLFKHSDIEKIKKQNKEGANKFKLTNLVTQEVVNIESANELRVFLNLDNVNNYYNTQYNNWYVEVIKTQKKTVKLIVNEEIIKFNSFNDCDKFLNKWRGYTSTQSLKNVKVLCGFPVNFIN